ncbi:nucleotidyltransferase domain-containing protein [Runella limosa]|uniref:nucleotidyltransferase domain-containing protein n=1 Tax=Runella limosa TaxID=370978 RepID=UPI000424ADE2|nr:nucleotidyltransferase domain-containing protein [Runella limosa]
MKKEIQKELLRLEKQHNIKILFAVESGSRAWGFASTNSDWDVRFVYIHTIDWYLTIDEKRDNIEEMLPNELDLSGWELKKALRLFRKSNPPLLEWLQSPIVYLEQTSTAQQLQTLTQEVFNPRACLHHYLHMAEGNYRDYLLKEQVRLKKYFYVLRPLLACDWILKTNSMAPVEFDVLLESQVDNPSIKAIIQELLIRKKAGEELNEADPIPALNLFLEDKIAFYTNLVKSIEKIDPPSSQLLNSIFRNSLNEAWVSS